MYNVKELTHEDISDFVLAQVGISKSDAHRVECGPNGWCVHVRRWDDWGISFRVERIYVAMQIKESANVAGQ